MSLRAATEGQLKRAHAAADAPQVWRALRADGEEMPASGRPQRSAQTTGQLKQTSRNGRNRQGRRRVRAAELKELILLYTESAARRVIRCGSPGLACRSEAGRAGQVRSVGLTLSLHL
jgi:hypothetical protein